MSTVLSRGDDPGAPRERPLLAPGSVLPSPSPPALAFPPPACRYPRLPALIDELWERRAELTPDDEQARAAVVGAVDAIDAGQARVACADPATGEVVVDERAKRAILLAFRVLPMAQVAGG